MIQNIEELKNIDERKIKVIVILPEDTGRNGSGNTIEFTDSDLAGFSTFNIEILKYNKILSEAKKMYREHLIYQQSAKLYPQLKSIEE